MTKQERTERLLTVECTRCGACCHKPWLVLTHRDLRRLVKATGIPASRLVRFSSPCEIDCDPEEPEWLELSYGRRMMCLRQPNGRCMFLDEGPSCRVYEVRPAACRVFPINVEFDEDGEVVGADLFANVREIGCRHQYGATSGREDILRHAKQAEREWESYARKVERWNASADRGGTREFLTYLGF